MKLIIIFGPGAVGKMTVGQELVKITDLKLFHNHMTIDIVSELFRNMQRERLRLIELFRKEIFEAYSQSDEYGMIFTFMWDLDRDYDNDYIEWLEKLFKDRGGEIYFVELEADFNVRITRNATENRLFHKPTKRDLEFSEKCLQAEKKYRLNSYDGEINKEHYIKINNADLAPEIVAEMIKEKFNL